MNDGITGSVCSHDDPCGPITALFTASPARTAPFTALLLRSVRLLSLTRWSRDPYLGPLVFGLSGFSDDFRHSPYGPPIMGTAFEEPYLDALFGALARKGKDPLEDSGF